MTQTPLQQAIEYVEVQMKKWRRTDSIDSPIYTAYGIVRDRLVIMLRDEKEFVGKVWNAGATSGYDNKRVHGTCEWDKEGHAANLIDFINELYPEK